MSEHRQYAVSQDGKTARKERQWVQKKYVLILLLGLFSCQNGTNEKLNSLKQNYTDEALNYFYELAFYDFEHPKKIHALKKWNKDLYFSLKGDTISGDKSKVIRVINQINDLNLPIKIYEAREDTTANLIFYFDKENQPNSIDKSGYATIKSGDDGIKIVYINIQFEDLALSLFHRKREAVILHEVFHSLGLEGHSFTYSNAILRSNLTITLTDIDKQIARLLYDPALPAGCPGERFEKTFSDRLYAINGKSKFLDFLKKNHIAKETVKNILQYGLSEDRKDQQRVVKLGYPTFVTLQGDYEEKCHDQIVSGITEINKVSEKLKLVLSKGDSVPTETGIIFIFKKNPRVEHLSVKQTNEVFYRLYYPGKSKVSILIEYRDNFQLQEIISHHNIPHMLYSSACLMNLPELAFENTPDDTSVLKAKYKEALQVYYNPSLPNGFRKAELESVLRQME